MSFFTNLRAERLVTEVRSASSSTDPAALRAAAKLKELGPGAIESILAALPDADKNATVILVDALSALVTLKSLPQMLQGLVEGSRLHTERGQRAPGTSYPPTAVWYARGSVRPTSRTSPPVQVLAPTDAACDRVGGIVGRYAKRHLSRDCPGRNHPPAVCAFRNIRADTHLIDWSVRRDVRVGIAV